MSLFVRCFCLFLSLSPSRGSRRRCPSHSVTHRCTTRQRDMRRRLCWRRKKRCGEWRETLLLRSAIPMIISVEKYNLFRTGCTHSFSDPIFLIRSFSYWSNAHSITINVIDCIFATSSFLHAAKATARFHSSAHSLFHSVWSSLAPELSFSLHMIVTVHSIGIDSLLPCQWLVSRPCRDVLSALSMNAFVSSPYLETVEWMNKVCL